MRPSLHTRPNLAPWSSNSVCAESLDSVNSARGPDHHGCWWCTAASLMCPNLRSPLKIWSSPLSPLRWRIGQILLLLIPRVRDDDDDDASFLVVLLEWWWLPWWQNREAPCHCWKHARANIYDEILPILHEIGKSTWDRSLRVQGSWSLTAEFGCFEPLPTYKNATKLSNPKLATAVWQKCMGTGWRMHDTIRHGRRIRPGKKGVGHMENSFARDNLWMCEIWLPPRITKHRGLYI